MLITLVRERKIAALIATHDLSLAKKWTASSTCARASSKKKLDKYIKYDIFVNSVMIRK
jgi:hypothetical protein